LELAVREIKETSLPAYFVPGNQENPEESKFGWVIVDRGAAFVKWFAVPWRRLSKSEFLSLKAFETSDMENAASQTCRAQILNHPGEIKALKDHVSDKHENDLVLRVWPQPGGEFPMKSIRERGYAETLVCINLPLQFCYS
jgi:hypothetical protein